MLAKGLESQFTGMMFIKLLFTAVGQKKSNIINN